MMNDVTHPEPLRTHEISGRITLTKGHGGLPKIDIRSDHSTAEIYLHGAQVTGFQKQGEAPLLFLSQASQFAADKPIRGGVPIIFPWFGPREGHVAHGIARTTAWEWIESSTAPGRGVTLRFRLPEAAARAVGFPSATVHFTVAVSDTLTMELTVANPSATDSFSFENCLHTYFAVGDIAGVAVVGLKGTTFLDKTDRSERKPESAEAIRFNAETDRVYLDTTSAVEIHDARLRRKICVEKSGSASTVVWNPWIAKAKAMPDFGDEEFKQMVCVESGNVSENKVTLAPGQSASLKVILHSQPI